MPSPLKRPGREVSAFARAVSLHCPCITQDMSMSSLKCDRCPSYGRERRPYSTDPACSDPTYPSQESLVIELDYVMTYKLDVEGPLVPTDASDPGPQRQFWLMVRATLEGPN